MGKDKFRNAMSYVGVAALGALLCLLVVFVINSQSADVVMAGRPIIGPLNLQGFLRINGNTDADQLVIEGNPTQTEDLLVLKNYSGTELLSVDGSGNLDVTAAGGAFVSGTASVTGTLAVSHGLTTVTWCMCTLGEDPTAGAGDAAMCTVTVSANVCTVKVWQDDFVTAATEADVDVHWLAVGVP